MREKPSQDQPPIADEVTPANEPPLLLRTGGQLVIVGVTPAVAQLARVARAIRRERNAPKQADSARKSVARRTRIAAVAHYYAYAHSRVEATSRD
ncbi:MAG: hypothetical protein WAK11_07935 [Candidatus Cybelea sp.]